MAEITGASLTPIYERLNGVPEYHPFEADTFCDWATEAGDIVTVSREGTDYQSPIHSMRLKWNGAPNIELNSTGNRERDPVSRVSKQKYRGGGSGMNTDKELYRDFYSDDGFFKSYVHMTATNLTVHFDNELDDVHSEVQRTASQIYSAVYTSESTVYSYVDQTATYINQVIGDVNRDLGTAILQTASEIRTEAHAAQSTLYSYVDETATYINSVVEDVNNNLGTAILQTANAIRSEAHAAQSNLYSYVNQTATNIRQVVTNNYTELSSQINQQADRIDIVVEGTGNNAHIRPAAITAAINNDQSSEVFISADKIDIDGNRTTLNDVITVTNASGHKTVIIRSNMITFGETLSTLATFVNGRFTANEYAYKEGSDQTVHSMIKDASVDSTTNTLTLTRFDGTEVNFSKAGGGTPTLTGAWTDGGKLTVSSNPIAVSNYVRYLSAGAKETQDGSAYAGEKQFYVPILVHNGQGTPPTYETTYYRAYVDATLTYQSGQRDVTLVKGEWQNALLTITKNPSVPGDSSVSVRLALVPRSSSSSNTIYDVCDVYDDPTDPKPTGYVVDYADKLDDTYALPTNQITRNGSYRPASGKVGFSRIMVNVQNEDSYSEGWVAACNNLNIPVGQNTGRTYIIVSYPDRAAVGGTPKAQTYRLSDTAENYADLIAEVDGGQDIVVARLNHFRYNGGWEAAVDELDIPETVNTGSSEITVTVPDMVGYSKTNTYQLESYDDNTIDLKLVGATQAQTKTVARLVHNKYLDGVAYGRNSVTINKGTWSGGIITFSKSAGTASDKTVQLTAATTTWDGNTASRIIWDGTAPDAQHGVFTGYTVTVDATPRYNAGVTYGRNDVTINKGTWSGGVITFSKSEGTASNKTVQLVAADTTWDGNTGSRVIWDGTAADSQHGVSTGYTVTVDATARYNAGVTYGRNDVTVTKGSWSGGVITFSKSAGTTSNQTVRLTAADTTWNGNTASRVIWDGTAPDAQHGVSTGYTVTVDATARYNAGRNAVTITKGSWSSGKITFSKSAGTASNQTVQLVAAATTWNGNTGSRVIWDGTAADAQHGVSTGYTVTVDATARYNAGRNDVTINKGSWSSGKITFSKSAGTASNQTVQLVAASTTWSGNTGSRVIWDGTGASSQYGVSTGYTVTVDATPRYNAGVTDGHADAFRAQLDSNMNTWYNSVDGFTYANMVVYNSSKQAIHTQNVNQSTSYTSGIRLPIGNKTITSNGTYSAKSESLIGFGTVTVNVSGGTPSASSISLDNFMVDSQKPSIVGSYTPLTNLSNLINNNHRTYAWFRATISGGTGEKWYQITLN